MDLEQAGKLINESIALQGKINSVKDEITALGVKIESAKNEVKRLEQLKLSVLKYEKEKENKDTQLGELERGLEERKKALTEDGWGLPLGNSYTRQVRV